MEVTPFPPKMGKCFDSASVSDGNGITPAVLAPAIPRAVLQCRLLFPHDATLSHLVWRPRLGCDAS